jgi:uncharacterized membrane protein
MRKTTLWLNYLVGWVTGLIFLATEKQDSNVRWHAANSVAVFGASTVALIVLDLLAKIPVLGIIFAIALWLVYAVTFILWIVLMVNAANDSRFEVPYLTDFGQKHFNKLFK